MEKVIINKVFVSKFRNIIDKAYNLYGDFNAFVGENHLGKTNMLNAIMWCLCGVDLDNASNSCLNAPEEIYINSSNGDVVIDVTCELNVGKVRRYCVMDKGSLKMQLEINDVPSSTLAKGEIEIDSILGIVGQTINMPDKFNLRRFLLNPKYCQLCDAPSFRKFIINQIKDKVVGQYIFETMLNDLQQNTLKPFIDETYDIENTSKKIDAQDKALKKEIDANKNVKAFLDKYGQDYIELKEILVENNSVAIKRQNDIKMAKVSMDKYVIEMSKAYNQAIQDQYDTKIELIEKGVGEDVWKNVCNIKVKTKIDYISIDSASTSEQIITGCKFICDFVNKVDKIPHLPILFDECETLDRNSIYLLKNAIDTQMICAKVEDFVEEIALRGF